MDFKDNKPIYLQIASFVSDKIAIGQWSEGERIPSVRELGGVLEVNPNTCMRAYEHLTRLEVISNARGVGYSVMKGAKKRVTELSQDEFFDDTLPEIFRTMDRLGITMDEIAKRYTIRHI